MRGRPLYFMALVLAGWVGARVALRWPGPGPIPLAAALPSLMPSAAAAERRGGTLTQTPSPILHAVPARTLLHWPVRPADTRHALAAPSEPTGTSLMVGNPRRESAPSTRSSQAEAPPGLPPLPRRDPGSRWSGSAWAILRDGQGSGGRALTSPLLGGSQAGFRLAYALGAPNRGAAVFVRGAVPLEGGRADLGLGVQWRPATAPVTLFAEARRDGRGVAPAAGLVGGASTKLGDFRLEGYGQAGVIMRGKPEAYGDGQLRLSGAVGPVEVGAGIWAAGQRGAARIDVGPSLALPIRTGPVAMRLTLDWRHRVAGDARPASGPVLALGADF